MKPKITSGASYTAHNPWADDPAVVDDPPFVQIDAAEGAKIDFKRAWTKWSRLDIKWKDWFTELKPSGPEGEHDLVHDLMPLPVGQGLQEDRRVRS